MSKTSMVITKATRDKLAALGGKDDSFEDIILRLIEEHEETKQK